MARKKNIIFGLIYLLFTLGLGFYLAGYIGWDGYIPQASGARRALLNSAYRQGNIDSVLNIAVGYIIYRFPFVEWFSRIISSLMIAGALLHSGMLYSAGFGILPFALNLIPLGAFIITAVTLFMGIGVLSIRMIK